MHRSRDVGCVAGACRHAQETNRLPEHVESRASDRQLEAAVAVGCDRSSRCAVASSERVANGEGSAVAPARTQLSVPKGLRCYDLHTSSRSRRRLRDGTCSKWQAKIALMCCVCVSTRHHNV